MSKIRINDLARELEVKSKAILDVLPEAGVTEKKTHSSSLEDHEAEKVRAVFKSRAEASSAGSRASRAARGDDEIKTKIDLSHISKPGDVLKLITQKQQAAAQPPSPNPRRPPHRRSKPGPPLLRPSRRLPRPQFQLRPGLRPNRRLLRASSFLNQDKLLR